ncbi:uncharacterized protein EV420DRAFT_642752 [Desarmillaria tabescens]|uniref:DUF6534 domain-containing protein n=1 Tax=Armillaria tabescens TaxID=1929756 RepID=A0AA39TYF2_ARMTA|nr:uncharacterized protein EV420DRAFT_642752 [Desarmillaria tabescens]KAK0466709.1 hypothetical protein EV420DRAFT_642752 [Desarmillaria tabescens]
MYTSQVALSIYYLCRFTMTKWLRYWILASLAIDGACSIAVLVHTYEYLVNTAGIDDVAAWTIPIIVLLTYASASITQAFFCYRCWTISRNKWIVGCIMSIITINMLFTLFFEIYISLYPKELTLALPLTISATRAATDMIITGSLVWICWHIESPYATTRKILRRVMVQALACGFTTAISTTLLTIFLLLTVLDAHYSLLVTLGRIYSLSVLLHLIVLKGMHRNDPCTMWIDGNTGTETSNTQLTPSETSHHYPTHLQSRTLANDQNSTV